MSKRARRCKRKQCGAILDADQRSDYCSLACSTAEMMDANRQMHAKSGPYYDRWCKAMRKAARGL